MEIIIIKIFIHPSFIKKSKNNQKKKNLNSINNRPPMYISTLLGEYILESHDYFNFWYTNYSTKLIIFFKIYLKSI